MAASFTESIGAIKTVQALSLEESFARAFTEISDKNLKQDVKGKRLSAGLERSLDVIIAFATALVLWFGARLVLAGEISVATSTSSSRISSPPIAPCRTSRNTPAGWEKPRPQVNA